MSSEVVKAGKATNEELKQALGLMQHNLVGKIEGRVVSIETALLALQMSSASSAERARAPYGGVS